MVLVDVKLVEQYECSVATTTMIMQLALMTWLYEAGCELVLSHAFPEISKTEN